MFKIVTNVEHWHNLYESRDCTEAFVRAPVDEGRGAQYPSAALARTGSRTSERQDVIALVTDDHKVLWSLEAIVCTKFDGNIGDALSSNSVVRQEAIGKLVDIATELDRSADGFEQKPEARKMRLMPFAVAAVGAVAVFNLVLWMGLSSRYGDVVVAMDTVHGKTMAAIEQKVAGVIEEFDEKLRKLRGDVKSFGDKMVGEVKGETEGTQTEVSELRTKYNKVENELVQLKDEILKDDGKQEIDLNFLKNEDIRISGELSKLRGEIASMKKPSGGIAEDNPDDSEPGVLEGAIPMEDGMSGDRQSVKIMFVQRYLAFGGYLKKNEIDGKVGANTWGAYNKWRTGICGVQLSELEIHSISVDEAIQHDIVCTYRHG